MHKHAYIFRTTHLVRWSHYLICIKTAPCEREPWWLLVRPSGKDQESGRARVPGSSIGFMFETCFYQYKPVPDFCFQGFFYLKHVRASVGAQSPFLCVVHVNIAAPPAQRKHFTKIWEWLVTLERRRGLGCHLVRQTVHHLRALLWHYAICD